MDKFRNILIGIGAVTVIVLIILIVAGFKVAGTLFAWIFGAILVLLAVGFIVYLIGKYKGRREASDRFDNETE